MKRTNWIGLFVLSVVSLLSITNSSYAQQFQECGWVEDEGPGCLILRTETGETYEIIIGVAEYSPGNYVHVNGFLGCTKSCPGVTDCVSQILLSACSSTNDTITSASDFQRGQSINLHTDENHLRINTWDETKAADPPVSPYVLVALSGRGTVVRIATQRHYSPIHGRVVDVGEVLGEYRTAPIRTC